jgi:hypothetical protein
MATTRLRSPRAKAVRRVDLSVRTVLLGTPGVAPALAVRRAPRPGVDARRGFEIDMCRVALPLLMLKFDAPGYEGAVYVFSHGTRWAQSAYVKASNTNSSDEFGSGLALNGDRTLLVVGARAEESSASGLNGDQKDNTAFAAGAAYRFARSSTGWKQLEYIKSSNPRAGTAFGERVALSRDGSTLAIAASGESSKASGIDGNQADSSAASAGAVYVFR